MIDLRPALARAKQFRTCPPLRVFEVPRARELVMEHLSRCAHCKAGREDESDWVELAEMLQDQFPPPQADEIRPGDVRFVRPELATWRGGLYYNPPGVVVIEHTPGVPDGFRVAQVYHDVSMAAPGDLVVDAPRTGGAGRLMVECWNTYSMKGSHLGPAVGRIPEEALHAVSRLEKDPHGAPGWAVRPAPIEEHDVRLYFRELEAEVGFIFASAAVDEIMAEIERPPLIYQSADEMKRDLDRRFPGISWPERFESLHEGLAAVRFPLERYAMAAADEGYEELPVNLVRIQAGIIEDIRPLRAEILQHTPLPNGLIVGGRIIGLPAERVENRLLAFLVREGRSMIGAAAKFDWGSGRFTATFKTAEAGRGSLKIAVFCWEDED